jgi:TonB family protein
MSNRRYARPVRSVALMALLLGCAQAPPRPEVALDCPAAVAAEKELAAKEGRPPVPIIRRGQLLTNTLDPENRPAITLDMAKEAKSATLQMVAKISVKADGGVEAVEVVKSSGSRTFDEVMAAKMKTWTHRPSLIDCRPVPYSYPMHWVHRYAP